MRPRRLEWTSCATDHAASALAVPSGAATRRVPPGLQLVEAGDGRALAAGRPSRASLLVTAAAAVAADRMSPGLGAGTSAALEVAGDSKGLLCGRRRATAQQDAVIELANMR